jgi:hypothetical protein
LRDDIIKKYYSKRLNEYSIQLIFWRSFKINNGLLLGDELKELEKRKTLLANQTSEVFLENPTANNIISALKLKPEPVKKGKAALAHLKSEIPPKFEFLPSNIDLIKMFSKAIQIQNA